MEKINLLLDRIEKQNLSYGDKIQPPARSRSIEYLENVVVQKFKIQLSATYKEILLKTDGIDNDGVVLYSSEKSLIVGYKDRYIDGFIEANEEWQSNKNFADYLFYADSDMYLFVQSLNDKTFSYRPRDRFEDIVFSTGDENLFLKLF